jgi:hypothetical protein
MIPNYDFFGVGSANKGSFPKNLNRNFAPVQFQRVSHDVGMWRATLAEAENPLRPNRVAMQRMYMDTILNGTSYAMWNFRKQNTLVRDFAIYELKNGKKEYSSVLSQQFMAQTWLHTYCDLMLDALGYGYSLIQLGDLVNDTFPNIRNTPREHIRPDGMYLNGEQTGAILTSLVYAYDGVHLESGEKGFLVADETDPLISLFNHYVTTPSQTGYGLCGLGEFFMVAFCEIHLRHLIEWNMDSAQLFGQPIRVGKTSQTGNERAEFERSLMDMGSSAAIIIDEAYQKLELVSPPQGGTQWKSYGQSIEYFEGVISQILLGHKDALRTAPDKLGGNQSANKDGFNINFIQQAFNLKQTSDADFLRNTLNQQTIPKIRAIGQKFGSKLLKNLVPQGFFIEQRNDLEDAEIERRVNSQTLQATQWAKAAHDAGMEVDIEQFSRHTGFKFVRVDKAEMGTPNEKLKPTNE